MASGTAVFGQKPGHDCKETGGGVADQLANCVALASFNGVTVAPGKATTCTKTPITFTATPNTTPGTLQTVEIYDPYVCPASGGNLGPTVVSEEVQTVAVTYVWKFPAGCTPRSAGGASVTAQCEQPGEHSFTLTATPALPFCSSEGGAITVSGKFTAVSVVEVIASDNYPDGAARCAVDDHYVSFGVATNPAGTADVVSDKIRWATTLGDMTMQTGQYSSVNIPSSAYGHAKVTAACGGEEGADWDQDLVRVVSITSTTHADKDTLLPGDATPVVLTANLVPSVSPPSGMNWFFNNQPAGSLNAGGVSATYTPTANYVSARPNDIVILAGCQTMTAAFRLTKAGMLIERVLGLHKHSSDSDRFAVQDQPELGGRMFVDTMASLTESSGDDPPGTTQWEPGNPPPQAMWNRQQVVLKARLGPVSTTFDKDDYTMTWKLYDPDDPADDADIDPSGGLGRDNTGTPHEGESNSFTVAPPIANEILSQSAPPAYDPVAGGNADLEISWAKTDLRWDPSNSDYAISEIYGHLSDDGGDNYQFKVTLDNAPVPTAVETGVIEIWRWRQALYYQMIGMFTTWQGSTRDFAPVGKPYPLSGNLPSTATDLEAVLRASYAINDSNRNTYLDFQGKIGTATPGNDPLALPYVAELWKGAGGDAGIDTVAEYAQEYLSLPPIEANDGGFAPFTIALLGIRKLKQGIDGNADMMPVVASSALNVWGSQEWWENYIWNTIPYPTYPDAHPEYATSKVSVHEIGHAITGQGGCWHDDHSGAVPGGSPSPTHTACSADSGDEPQVRTGFLAAGFCPRHTALVRRTLARTFVPNNIQEPIQTADSEPIVVD